MSKKVIAISAFLIFIFSNLNCQQQIDVESEKEEIKKVVQDQLDAMKEFSVEGESAVWAHKPYVVRYTVVGWDSVLAHYQTMMPTMEKRYQIDELTADKIEVHLNGNFAAVFHVDNIKGFDKQDNTGLNNTNNMVLKYLEKINGEWKIIAQFNAK